MFVTNLLVFSIIITVYQLLVHHAIGLAVPPTHHKRIVGGFYRNIGIEPFTVSLTITKDDQAVFCGGVLLSEKVVVTAGSCLITADKNVVMDKSVTVGYGNSSLAAQTQLPSNKVFVHPMFVQGDKLNLKYDIGIVVVDRIPFNQYVSRVRVSDSIMVEGLAYTTSGWGVRNHTANVASGMPNSELQGAYVIAGKDSECAKSPVFTNQTSTPICTYNIKDFENGGCFGDAGSGLFVVNLGGAMDLMGVRSYSVLGKDGVCAGEGALEYYTRVSLMLDFIKDVTGLTEEDVKAPPIYVYYNKNSPASDAAERTESSTSDEPVKQKYY